MPRRVVHHQKSPHDIYIGRGTKWASPFSLGEHGTRDIVVAKYRAWLRGQPGLLEALPELRGKVLGCECAPYACHGDVLVELCDAQERYERLINALGDAAGDYKQLLRSMIKEELITGALSTIAVKIGREVLGDWSWQGISLRDICLDPCIAKKEKAADDESRRPSAVPKRLAKTRKRR